MDRLAIDLDRVQAEMQKAHDRPRVEYINGVRFVHTAERIYGAWRVLRAMQEYHITGIEPEL